MATEPPDAIQVEEAAAAAEAAEQEAAAVAPGAEDTDNTVAGPVAGELVVETADDLDAEKYPPCAICNQPITGGQDFVAAAYGRVNAEPCSHLSRQV